MTDLPRPFPRVPAHVRPCVEVPGVDLAVTFLLGFGGADPCIRRTSDSMSELASVIGSEGVAALASCADRLPRRVPLAKARPCVSGAGGGPGRSGAVRGADRPRVAHAAARVRCVGQEMAEGRAMTISPAQPAGLRDDLHRARAAVIEARDQLARAEGTLTKASIALEADFNAAGQRTAEQAATAPVTEHLRRHRPGRPQKLAVYPELRAFVEARFNRLTFDQIAAQVAANFPPERRVRRSAFHDWWQRVHKRKKPDHPG